MANIYGGKYLFTRICGGLSSLPIDANVEDVQLVFQLVQPRQQVGRQHPLLGQQLLLVELPVLAAPSGVLHHVAREVSTNQSLRNRGYGT